MGTVGLNFGSPTSGAGFDVQATVDKMVANLQRAEQPSKDQISSLRSQDAVFSSLGTLLSTLTTNLQQLTDFSGVLARKTGSSSDTNVLQLTSASPKAVAGTHSIAVNSLAKTASGCLTPIASASETLSGSIDIQVGSGAVHTIRVGTSNNTLSGLAASINSAGIGVIASILTDSKGARLSLVSNTPGSRGDLNVVSSIIDTGNAIPAALTYKGVVTGMDASLTVDGVDLTSGSNTVTDLIPGVTFQLLSPSSLDGTGKRTDVQVVIGNDNSGVETAINTVVTDYNALMKAITAQKGKDATGKAEPLFGSPTLSLLQQQLMGGVNEPSSNGILDPIDVGSTLSGGLTVQVGTGPATAIAVPDSDRTVEGLAKAVNAANLGVTASVTTSNGQSFLTFYSALAGAAGALTIDSSITASSTGSDGATTSTAVNYVSSSDIPSLSAIGISASKLHDGSLTFDAPTLVSLLNSDFSGVLGFFQGVNSWGKNFANILNHAGTASSVGTLSLAQKSNASIEQSLDANITKKEAIIESQKKRLTTQLNKANEILQSIPTRLNGMDQLYSAITGYKKG